MPEPEPVILMISKSVAKIKYVVDVSKTLVQQRLTRITLPSEPHFDEKTQLFFLDRLPKSQSYLEFGSGGSTMMAARLGIPTISIESDRRYATHILKTLGPMSSVKLLHADIGWTRDWGQPIFRNPTASRVSLWRNYVQTALNNLQAVEFPDFVLVDGRFRQSCALHIADAAILRNTKCDILFDDYADRTFYHTVENFLGKPELIGRSALFKVNPNNNNRIPENALAQSNADPR